MKEMGHTVRGISPDNWKWLKSVAAFRGVPIGQLLNEIIDEWAAEPVDWAGRAKAKPVHVRKSGRSASVRAN